ncbi:MAG TPA: hypothetical protein VK668_14340 [Mucilaginibacter sp.]|nr:hypothetical protein [Mucilaginibacter sp.]
MVFMIFAINAGAQSNFKGDQLISGRYGEVELSYDSASKRFTGIDHARENEHGSILFSGKMIKSKSGFIPVKVYESGNEGNDLVGRIVLKTDKNGQNYAISIVIDKDSGRKYTGYIQNGDFLPLDKIYPYHKFSMIKSAKINVYSDTLGTVTKGASLFKGDLVSILAENKHYSFVQFIREKDDKRPALNGWVRKSDLIL